jgi:Flp pilus assembly protein protease CpaA
LGLILLALLGLAAVTDFRWHRIPNWATYTAALWAVALNAAHTLGVPPATQTGLVGTVGLPDSLLGGGVCFLCTLVLFGTTGGGAGDVKLLTVIGAMLGLNAGIHAMLYGFIAAGAGCLAWALWKHGPLAILKAFGRLVGGFLFPRWVGCPTPEQVRLLRLPVPLAPFFALGTILAVKEAWCTACYRWLV